MALKPIFFDIDMSKFPIADTNDETMRGIIRHFNARRNNSPKYPTYIISLLVHGSLLEYLKIKPSATPPNTPETVRIGNRCDFIALLKPARLKVGALPPMTVVEGSLLPSGFDHTTVGCG